MQRHDFQSEQSQGQNIKQDFNHLLVVASLAKISLSRSCTEYRWRNLSRPCIHTLHPPGRQQRRRHHTAQRNTPRKIQHGINIPIISPTRRTIPVQGLRNQRTHNPKQPAPKTRHTTRRPAHMRRKRLGRPAIEHRIEHALKKVLEAKHAEVFGNRVNGCEEENGDAHERRRKDHGPFAAEARHAVHDCAGKDAEDAACVGVDVRCVGEGKRLGGCAVFEGEDAREVETCSRREYV